MSLPPSFRRVVVDDADASFNYGPSWSLESSNARDATVNSGPAFDRTLHRTSDNTTFSVNFTGSDIVVSSSVTPILVNDVVQKYPQWECIIDGISLGNTSIDSGITQPQNNLGICQSALGDGPHQLVVKVTTTAVAPFWIDDIQYSPSSNADLSNATLKVYNSDPNIKLSSDFTTGTYGVKLTQQTGGSATFDFWGKSVTWVGYIFAGFANVSSTASYTIDGGAPVAINLPTSGVSYGNSIFFKTPDLTPGPHTLAVTHNGNNKSMPLVLDYLFVTNTTLPSASTTTTTGSSSSTATTTNGTSAVTATPSHGPKPHTATVAGGVAGGVVVLAIVVGYFVWRYWPRSYAPPSSKTHRDFEQDGADGAV